jgi:hypothetical protein
MDRSIAKAQEKIAFVSHDKVRDMLKETRCLTPAGESTGDGKTCPEVMQKPVIFP